LEELTENPIRNPKGDANRRIAYAAMVEEMDMTLVDVLNALEAKGDDAC